MGDRTTWMLAVLVVGSAIAFDPGGWHPFGPAKWLVVTATALAALAWALADGVEMSRGATSVIGLTLGWGAFTGIVGVDPLSAFVGTPDRRMGLIGLATLAAAFVAGHRVDTPHRRRLLARAGCVALMGMGAYAVAEAAGVAPIELDLAGARLGSTFGSPAYLGAATALLIPVAIAVGVAKGQPKWWRGIGVVASAAGVALVSASGTRAALVGLAAAAAVSVRAWWPLVRRRPQVLAAGVVAAAVLVAMSPLGERVADLPRDPLAQGRLDEWAVAGEALLQQPLTGYGLEGYRVVFPAIVGPEYVQAYGRTTVTDRAHSGPLDMGVALGFPGLLLWLLAAGWVGRQGMTAAGWVGRRGWAVAGSDPILTGIAAGVAGWMAQQILLFPTLEVGAAALTLMGAIAAGVKNPVRLRSKAAAVTAAVLAVTAVAVGMLDVAADRLAAAALAPDGTVTQADRASRLRPDSFLYPLAAAQVAASSGDYDDALSRIGKALELSPGDPGLREAQAALATSGALAGEVPADAALGVARAAVEEDPNHPRLRLLHGRLATLTESFTEAENALLAAEYLIPDQVEPALALARLYIGLGETEAARSALERAEATDPDHPDIPGLKEILGIP